MANERILIVDDEHGVMRSCQRILNRYGFVATGVTDSQLVPDLLRQETFDLLLTDIRMPKLDGLQLLQIAKSIDPHLAVVMITGYGTMEDAIKAIQFGASGFLMKPFDPDELTGVVEENLARRTLVRDSIQLQTLLPLLEINKVLQISGGEVSLVQQVLETASTQLGAARLAWLSLEGSPPALIEAAVVSCSGQASELPQQVLVGTLQTGQPAWQLTSGDIVADHAGLPNVSGAVLPLLVKGQPVGILTAEAGSPGEDGRFAPISLELLSLLAGQLAIIIENVQLFQQTESLRAFNEEIIHTMTNGLIAVNQAGQITVINPAATSMLNCPPEQALGQTLRQNFCGANELARVFDTTLTSGQPQPRQEITIESSPDRTVPISVSTALLAQGGAVGVIENLSEIKALEAEHRRLDRLAALGEMSAVVAHELRNPIAGVAAGVEYLTRNAAFGSAEQQGAAMIQSEIERVNRILEDILFVARPLQLERELTQLPPILNRVVARALPQATASSITIRTHFADDLPSLPLDCQRIEQVFSNFLGNAIQAMPNGGTLTLTVEQNASDQVQTTVADTGTGISPQLLDRIFDPFFTTKTRGTGLGLSIARRIVEAHNGLVKVDSQPGRGTSFYILLPAKTR